MKAGGGAVLGILVATLAAPAAAAKVDRTKLGWTPRVTFKELVRLMVDADMEGGGRPVRPRG